MNLKEQLKAALKRAGELASKSELSEDETNEALELAKSIPDLREKIKRQDEAAAALKSLAADDDAAGDAAGDQAGGAGAGDGAKSGGARTAPRDEALHVKTFGTEFVNSKSYQDFRKAFPSGLGDGTPFDSGRVKVGNMADYFASRKAPLTVDVGRVQPIRMPAVDQVDRDRLTFLDLVTRGSTGGNFEYVQITGVTRNAAIVAESTGGTGTTAADGFKPTSEMTTALADAKVYTYADGYDVTNQLLSDAPAMATYMNTELAYSLDWVVEDKLLNGTGLNGEPKGILNTTGVQQQEYTAGVDPFDDASAMAFIKGVRKGITKVTRLPGGTVQAIVLSPEMDEAIDLLQDANDRFYGGGPFQSGPQTLWGRPRVVSERLAGTDALLGDFRQVALLDREGLSVQAFNQHKDYAQRNMVYVRAELRAAQVIWKPNRLALVTPAAGV